MGSRNRAWGDYVDSDRSTPQLGRTAVQGGGITVISRVACQVIQLGATMILSRLLLPEDFGVVAMVTSIVGFVLLFGDLGLTDATLQAESMLQRQASILFWVTTLFNLAVALILAASSPLLALLYKDPRVGPITLVLAVQVVVFGAANQHYTLLKRSMAFVEVSISALISTVLSNALAIAAVLLGFGYWSLIIRELASAATRALVGWYLCRWRPSIVRTLSGAGGLIKFGVTTMGSLGVAYFSDNLDKTLVGVAYGASPLGYYTRAFGLFTLPLGQFSSSLHHVAVSILSRVRTDKREFVRLYLRAVETISLLGMPLAALITITSSDLVLFLFGPQWSQSAVLLALLAPSAGFRMLYVTNDWLNASLGRADRRLKWQIISLCGTVCALGIGLIFSLKGVTISYSVLSAVLVFPALLYAGQPAGLKLRAILGAIWRSVVAAVLAAVPSGWFAILIRPSFGTFPTLCATSVIFILLYACAILVCYWGLSPFQDIVYMARLVLGRRGRQG
jgi:O-antigen/teichoic acid export membrane protein